VLQALVKGKGGGVTTDLQLENYIKPGGVDIIVKQE
jgi:hypothetical protein